VTSHDPATFTQLSLFNMPSGHYYHGMSFDAAGNLYADDLYTKIVKLTKTGAKLAELNARGHAYGVAWIPTSGHLYQLDGQTRVLYELDTTGIDVASVQLAISDASVGGIAFDGTTLWVVGISSGSVYRVSTTTGATLAVLSPAAGQLEGIAWDGKCLWLSDTSLDRVLVVDHGQTDLPKCTLAVVPDAGAPSDAGADASPRDAGIKPAPKRDAAAQMPDAASGELPLPSGGGAAAPDEDGGIEYPDIVSSAGCACRAGEGDAPRGLGMLALAGIVGGFAARRARGRARGA
jgi:MYXO-CTERM domain-containing protein